jgi:PIN domain nuclease of toxin-antitoxin system
VIALLDTHILVWSFERPTKLSAAQNRVLQRARGGRPFGVSDITSWEVALLVERGQLKLDRPIDAWLLRATAPPLAERCGITPAIAREVASLSTTRDWDPGDRILVATARVHGVPLVTSDARVIESGLVETI